MQIADTMNPLLSGFCVSKGRQQERDQNPDDRHDDNQFNEAESAPVPMVHEFSDIAGEDMFRKIRGEHSRLRRQWNMRRRGSDRPTSLTLFPPQHFYCGFGSDRCFGWEIEQAIRQGE